MPAIRSPAIRPIGRRRGTSFRKTGRRFAATRRLAFGTALAGLALLVLATQVSGQPVTTGGVGPQTGPTYPEIAQLPGDAELAGDTLSDGTSIAMPVPHGGHGDDLRDDMIAPPPRGHRAPAPTR